MNLYAQIICDSRQIWWSIIINWQTTKGSRLYFWSEDTQYCCHWFEGKNGFTPWMQRLKVQRREKWKKRGKSPHYFSTQRRATHQYDWRREKKTLNRFYSRRSNEPLTDLKCHFKTWTDFFSNSLNWIHIIQIECCLCTVLHKSEVTLPSVGKFDCDSKYRNKYILIRWVKLMVS